MNKQNIKDITPFLQDIFTFEDCSENAKSEYWKRRHIAEKEHPILTKYFWNNLHDSDIIDVDRTNNNLTLSINDINARTFSTTLSSAFGIEIDDRKYPLNLIFENLEYFSINSVNESGCLFEEEFSSDYKLDFLGDELIEISENRVKIALVLFKKNDNKQGQHLIMLISAEKLTIIEKQMEILESSFPINLRSHIDYFANKRNQFEYSGDQSICMEWIKECKAGNKS